MTCSRRSLVGLIAAGLAVPAAVRGQTPGPSAMSRPTFPTRGVTIVVPFPPGGGTDTGARIVAHQLATRWAYPVLVENRGGGVGQVGGDYVSKGRADGHLMLMGNVGTQAIGPALYPALAHDADRAFAPVSLVAELPLALMVDPALPATTAAALVAYARARPGLLSYGSSGAGGAPHLTAELFKQATGTHIVHVPYRGGGPAIADLLAGQIDMAFMTVFEAIGHLRSGRLRVLAVTGTTRVGALPDVPTLAETVVPGFEATSWIGLLAPYGTPAPVVERISADVRDTIAQPDVAIRITDLGGVPRGSTPAQFAAFISRERARYAAIIRDRRITTD